MVFMSDEDRQRHTVRPGLSGLAQVSGRNSISWEDKLRYDLEYEKNITLLNDAKLVLRTLKKAGEAEGITDGVNATALDYGDVLLKEGKIDRETYDRKQMEAMKLLQEAGWQ